MIKGDEELEKLYEISVKLEGLNEMPQRTQQVW